MQLSESLRSLLVLLQGALSLLWRARSGQSAWVLESCQGGPGPLVARIAWDVVENEVMLSNQ